MNNDNNFASLRAIPPGESLAAAGAVCTERGRSAQYRLGERKIATTGQLFVDNHDPGFRGRARSIW